MTSSPTTQRPKFTDRIQSAYKGIEDQARDLSGHAAKQTDPEQHQHYIRELDQVLKLVSIHQRNLGVFRRELGKANEALRKAKPKGKAAQSESVPFEIEGKLYQLINGRPVELKSSTGKPDEKD